MLNVCVIDTDTGLLYEWNRSLTVNVYQASDYARYIEVDGDVATTIDMWTFAEDVDASEFVESVEEHINGR